MHWYLEALRKYAVFSGRSRRSEYWLFVLVNIGVSISLGIVDMIAGLGGGVGMLGMVYSLAVLIPGLAVSVRRLHDTGRSGWWLLVAMVPLVGVFVLLYFMAQDGEHGPNQYGPNPKHAEIASAGGVALG